MHPLLGTERAVLVKKDGTRHEIRAQFSRRGVLTADVQTPVEAGDAFERSLPTGGVEIYDVADATLVVVSSSVPSLYDCRVRKRAAKKVPRLPDTGERDVVRSRQRVRTRPETVSPARVLFEVDKLFADLRAAVTELVPASRRNAVLAAVAEMQASRGTNGFAAAYARFLGLVADHIEPLRTFMPALVNLAGWAPKSR